MKNPPGTLSYHDQPCKQKEFCSPELLLEPGTEKLLTGKLYVQVPAGGWEAPDKPHEVMGQQYDMLQYFEQLPQPGQFESLFSLLPLKQGFTISHVKVDSTGLHKLIHRSPVAALKAVGLLPASGHIPPQAQFMTAKAAWWADVLDMRKVAALKPGWQFQKEVTTDGYAVSILYKKACRPAQPPPAPEDLDLNNFDRVGY